MAVSQTRVQGVDAIYYRVEDLDRAIKFYTDLLGMEP
ncbi:MAG: VOC family protein, partial [Candidatus Eremiobacteraeota bacterium]|nr:VOC family protein [Candidatus Eremiobacteraeota bacterium]